MLMQGSQYLSSQSERAKNNIHGLVHVYTKKKYQLEKEVEIATQHTLHVAIFIRDRRFTCTVEPWEPTD